MESQLRTLVEKTKEIIDYELYFKIKQIIELSILRGYLTEYDIEQIFDLFNNYDKKEELTNKESKKSSKKVDIENKVCYNSNNIIIIQYLESLKIELVNFLCVLYFNNNQNKKTLLNRRKNHGKSV